VSTVLNIVVGKTLLFGHINCEFAHGSIYHESTVTPICKLKCDLCILV